MAAVSSQGLASFAMNWSHHGSSYDWTTARSIFGLEFHRYRNVHALQLERDDTGIWVMWKQYVTDEAWSKPKLLVEHDRVAIYARARPPLVPHEFAEKNKYLNFLDRLDPLMHLFCQHDFAQLPENGFDKSSFVFGHAALNIQESSLAASGLHPKNELAELRSYVNGLGLDAGPSLESWLQCVTNSVLVKCFAKFA